MDRPDEQNEGHGKKRKRAATTIPPPLDLTISSGEESATGMVVANRLAAQPGPSPTIQCQVNIPLGYSGPLLVQMFPGSPASGLLVPPTPTVAVGALPHSGPGILTPMPSPAPNPTPVIEKGFMKLPGELRNNIYRLVFVAEDSLTFGAPNNFVRSSQLLRTCKKIHDEGCSILYGENKFVFNRNRQTHSPFWIPEPQEIGYRDVQQFFKMIGPKNMLNLRDIEFWFEDANGYTKQHRLFPESRRYINDAILADCIQTLATQANLRTAKLGFFGKKTLTRGDHAFIGYLKKLKVDNLKNKATVPFVVNCKIQKCLWPELVRDMERPMKLYLDNTTVTANAST
ncbi:hypothetical protein B0J11DRAFT_509105 [Dendryphion nanum]|uniref:Uncharacterized protein n=1 Tax=Dendryphion nanum TaxID=256645 RepID=A0A9P9IEN8_9PLEO|nr:hypothetical protein B0J11DRAFT_509105 [Dendryphion nanum]